MKKNVALCLLIIIIGWGLIGDFKVPKDVAEKPIPIWGQTMPSDTIIIVEDLSFVDGIANGTNVFGSFLKSLFIGIWDTFTDTFSSNMIWNLIWLIIGLPLSFIFQFILTLFVGVVVFFKMLFINTSIYYHIGYISSLLICCVIGSIAGADDKVDTVKKDRSL